MGSLFKPLDLFKTTAKINSSFVGYLAVAVVALISFNGALCGRRIR